jgi:Flp pilus assembly protein TadD
MHYLIVLLLVLFAPLGWAETVIVDEACHNKYGAKLVSLQGAFLVDPGRTGRWQTARLNQMVCEGSGIKVAPNSRASLRLSNGIVLRLHEGTSATLDTIAPGQATLLNLLNGFVHFISRTPRLLKISTPIANAGPEGTEFAMRVDGDQASLWVYEGSVKFYNDQGSVQLKPGQGAQAQLGSAPQAKIDIKPQDAVNWALYYPPVLAYPKPTDSIDPGLRTAIQDFRQGHLDTALAKLESLPKDRQSPYFHQVRAALRLTAGQDKLALQDIQALLTNNPNHAEALALKSVLALTQNRKDEALALATKATTANPQSASAYSALSYAEQGRFDLDKAQAAANEATKLAPHDAFLWARKAELELSQGLTQESQKTANKALELDPGLERTQTVAGFSQLLHMDTGQALQSFQQAVTLDSTAPLPRLGLGLAKIRSGDLEQGREDLETAAVLDPNNAIVRSYLGKAYYEERRSKLAEDQFGLAKERDPKDPTPYFYDAINKQTINRPVEALHDMQKAIELNDNRAVYRSKLLLDKDAAARTANVARIYNDLGFGRVALKEAWKSLNKDSTNPSAHRFLSDAYLGQPRFRVARASELLQAQLLQPINITPVQPQLTSENIGILNSTGPGSLSLNEYDPLYNANGAHVVLNGAYGSNDTKTDNAIISGVYNNLSGSLGQFHYETDGFRQNDDYQQDIYDAFAQYAITPDLSVQLELKSDDIRSGDAALRLNGFHQEKLRKIIEQDTIRTGGHYRIDPAQDLIFSAFYTTLKDLETNSKFKPLQNDRLSRTDDFEGSEEMGYQTELQYIYHPGTFDITAGFGYINLASENEVKKTTFGIDPNGPSENFCNGFNPSQILCSASISKSKTEYLNGYVYSKQYLLPNLTTILGFSYDSYEDNVIDRQQFNPKFGLIWNPWKYLTIRSAVFRSLKRPLATNQTIEPTQVAGFNQFYDGNNGTTAWQGGFGLDYNPIKSIYLGGEVTWRDGNQPITNESGQAENQNRQDSSHLAYFYWVPFEWLSFRSEYRYEKFNRDFTLGLGDPTDPRSIETQQAPFSINFYHDSGFFGKLTGTYVNQQVEFVNDEDQGGAGSLPPLDKQNENFWTFDVAVGYRLPKKIGIISFEVRNLFDNNFTYQSSFDASGPQLTPFVPERQLFGKLSLFF